MTRPNKLAARFGPAWLYRGDPTLSELFRRLRAAGTPVAGFVVETEGGAR